eukprot:XP_001705152.1 Hypothetical protein GL50803_26800 [Giardia lamblia ATCC 50803]
MKRKNSVMSSRITYVSPSGCGGGLALWPSSARRTDSRTFACRTASSPRCFMFWRMMLLISSMARVFIFIPARGCPRAALSGLSYAY